MNKSLLALFIFNLNFAFAQEKNEATFSFLVDVLGSKGVTALVGMIFFFLTYKNSIKLFQWIEDQTFGTRDYILQKCELIHFEIQPFRVTIILLILSFGISSIIIGLFALLGNLIIGLVLGSIISVIGWKVPRPFMDNLVESRIKKYQLQMVDALSLLSNGLRAGLSLPQSLGMVVDELPAPVSQEFNTVLQQTKIGVPLEEAFENLVKRVPTQDNEMFVTSINILRETGGNLAEVFDTITDVIRERVRLQQKIDTYIAQGKFQGFTIVAMPWALGLLNTISDPASMKPLVTTPVGIVLLLIALILNVIGAIVILKVIKIEV